jgi:hypothetical protein
MPVKILSRSYLNNLETAPNNTTNFLLGNVGEWQQLTLECEMSSIVELSNSSSLTIDAPNKLVLNDGTAWGDLGFYVGARINVIVESTNLNTGINFNFFNIPFFVGIMYGNTIEVNDVPPNGLFSSSNPITDIRALFPGVEILPFRDQDYSTRSATVEVINPTYQGIEIQYAHQKNSQIQAANLNNILDGTRLSFVAEDTNLTAPTEKYELNQPNEVDHYLTPFQSGLSVEKVTVTYRGNQGNKAFYDIDIIYMLSSFGGLLEFQNIEAPDELEGSESLADQVKILAFPVYNNPNVQISNDVRAFSQEGNVGWFNENYNQLPNLFSASNVVYTNAAGTAVSQLDYANPITMTTTISGTGFVPVAGQTRVQIGFIWNPLEEDYYKRTPYSFHKCRKVNTGGSDINSWFNVTATPIVQSPFPSLKSGYTTNNVPLPLSANDIQGQLLYDSQNAAMDMSDIIVVQNGNDIDISVTFRPDTNFAAWMDSIGENERGYGLWVSVGDQTPPSNQSDRVALLLDVNVLDTYIEPIGEYEGMTIEFLDHPKDYTDTPSACGNNIHVEDDLLAKISFQEETDLTIDDTPELTKITYGFLVENTTDGQQYVLDASDIDMTQFPDPTQYNFSQSRDFKLGTGNSKNWFKLDYDAPNDSGTKRGVLGWYGYKIRWEDWIKRFPTPPNDFYNNTELQNGLNNDWFHYFNTSGWNFYFYVNLTAILNGQTVVYQNLKEITIKDYDSNSDITTEIKYYRDNNGVKGTQLIGGTDPISGLPLGVIIKNEYVWLDIEYTWVGAGAPADWASQVLVDANVYATNCFEVDKGAGQKQFRQLSSIWNPEFDNPVEGIPSATLATVTQVSTTKIRVEARINGNKILDAPRYKISGRIGCK